MSYYNSTKEKGGQLKLFTKKANNQNNKVLDVFIRAGKELGASDVYRKLNRSILLTSVRRSIKSLEAEEILSQTGNKKMGMYGRPEYTWELSI